MTLDEILVGFTPRQARIVLREMGRIERESDEAAYRREAHLICERLRRKIKEHEERLSEAE